MSKLITRGIPRADGGKDYEIRDGVERYLATRAGSRWECRQKMFASIREIKAAILKGAFDAAAEASQPECRQNSTWDCCDPCALLILYSVRAITPPPDQLMRTLDAHGWLDDRGEFDIARAEREMTRAGLVQGRLSEADTEWPNG